MTQSKRPRRTFTPEFKHQLVQLYKNGKRKSEITKEYDVGYSTLDKCKTHGVGSFISVYIITHQS